LSIAVCLNAGCWNRKVNSVNAHSMTKVTSVNARRVTSAKFSEATSTETLGANSAETFNMNSAKTDHAASVVNTARARSSEATHASPDVTSAKTAHVASATVSSTSACLCSSGKKAGGKRRTCQDHHPSSSHDILLWNGRSRPPRGTSSDVGILEESKCRHRDGLEMERLVCCFN
jgi:hypothetical protein